MFISLQNFRRNKRIIAASLKKYLKPHYYLKNYLTIGKLQIFQPFIKMAINQNFVITVLSVWLVSLLSANSWKKKLEITY